MSTREIGDLTPIRRFAERLAEWHAEDRERRPAGDPLVHALAELEADLLRSLEDAASLQPGLTVDELARLEGVTPAAIYKRRARGKLPQAEKVPGGRIRIDRAAA